MRNFILYILGTGLLLFAGCDSYLDKMPDKRAELNTNQKIGELLVSAYPNVDPMMIYEHRTDNALDAGKEWGYAPLMISENYFWKNNSETDWDAPERLWGRCYMAVATANQALEAIEEIGRGPGNEAFRGEALACRAYAHFLLANTFCMPYSETGREKDMGIPYVTQTEKVIGTTYERGTIGHVYDMIEKDILEAFELIDDNAYIIPLYHFNKRAVAAFATRFFVYKGDFEKALKFADFVLEKNPEGSLRDLVSYRTMVAYDEWKNRFSSKDEPANLMLIPLRSMWGRTFHTLRYCNTDKLTKLVTYRAAGPWGRYMEGYDFLFYGRIGNPIRYQPRFAETFEVTNVTAFTGQPHVVQQAFTTDETLLCRAEAEVMLEKFDDAARDLSYYYKSKGGKTASLDDIAGYYESRAAWEKEAVAEGRLEPWHVVIKPFDAVYNIKPGKQEIMLQAVLHARRIETMYSGLRWLDIRRYGIEVIHNRDEEEPIVLPQGDPRRVIQIPASVVASGITPNANL